MILEDPKKRDSGGGGGFKQTHCFRRALLYRNFKTSVADPGSGSEFFQFQIQGQKDFGSGSTSKNLSIINPKKLILSSRKYDPGCSSRIRIPDPVRSLNFYPSRFQGSKRHRIPDPDPQHCMRRRDFGLFSWYCYLASSILGAARVFQGSVNGVGWL
jgi:hypothetical protein